MVSGDTPTSPLVAFALLNPVTLSREHLAIALKVTKSLTAFSRLSTLLAHLVETWEESLSCFSTGMFNNREILGAHLFLDSSRSKKMHRFGAGHQRSAQPAGCTSRSHSQHCGAGLPCGFLNMIHM